MDFRLFRQFIGLALYCCLIISCDSRIDELDQFNDSPYFLLNTTDTVTSITDSLKLSQGSYVIAPRVIDGNNNIAEIIISRSAGDGDFRVNGMSIDQSLAVSYNVNSMTYHPRSHGQHSFTITAKDAFGLTADLSVNLTVFVNIPPTLVVEIIKPSGAGPFERLIDASKSFDGDERFGGSIVEYEYTFLNIKRNIQEPTQTVIFPEEGNYNIQVRIRDNDNVWTDLQTTPLQIP
jgi:hypothetical protein